jgi:hypothetical protein
VLVRANGREPRSEHIRSDSISQIKDNTALIDRITFPVLYKKISISSHTRSFNRTAHHLSSSFRAYHSYRYFTIAAIRNEEVLTPYFKTLRRIYFGGHRCFASKLGRYNGSNHERQFLRVHVRWVRQRKKESRKPARLPYHQPGGNRGCTAYENRDRTRAIERWGNPQDAVIRDRYTGSRTPLESYKFAHFSPSLVQLFLFENLNSNVRLLWAKITDYATSRLLPLLARTDLKFFYSIDFTNFLLLYFSIYIEI